MGQGIGHFAFGVAATTGILMVTGLDKKIKNTEPTLGFYWWRIRRLAK